MRGLAAHRQRRLADAARRQRDPAFLRPQGWLAGEDEVVLGAGALDERACAGRADLLIAVNHHGERAVRTPVHGLQYCQRMQDERDAALVVGDPRAVGPRALDAERPLGERAARIDRVHVREQHDPPRAAALKSGDHHLADLLRRVEEAIGVGGARLVELHLGAERREPLVEARRQAVEPLLVAAPRFDVDELAQRLDHRRLFLLRQRPDRFLRRRLRGRRERPGEHEDQCSHSGLPMLRRR